MSSDGVLFLHHFGGSARSWDAVIARMDGIETIAIDLPGFGAAAASAGPFDVAACADIASAALRLMASDRLWIVGHSMGGKIALALAARQPYRVGGLVLLAPSPPTAEPMAPGDRDAALAGWGSLAHAEATLARITAVPLGSHARALALDDMLRTGHAAWRAWLEAGSREDISALMPHIAIPAVILCGGNDCVIPCNVQRREVASRLRNATVVEIPDAGHLLPLEAPDAVAAAIRAGISPAGRMA